MYRLDDLREELESFPPESEDSVEASYELASLCYLTDPFDPDVLREVEIWYNTISGYYSTYSTYFDIRFYFRDSNNMYHLIMKLDLDQGSDGLISVCEVMLAKKFAGFRFAPKLYASLVQLFPRFKLMAGYDQSLGGRKLWYRLAQMPSVKVSVYDGVVEKRIRVDHKNYEVVLSNGKPIYNTENDYTMFLSKGVNMKA